MLHFKLLSLARVSLKEEEWKIWDPNGVKREEKDELRSYWGTSWHTAGLGWSGAGLKLVFSKGFMEEGDRRVRVKDWGTGTVNSIWESLIMFERPYNFGFWWSLYYPKTKGRQSAGTEASSFEGSKILTVGRRSSPFIRRSFISSTLTTFLVTWPVPYMNEGFGLWYPRTSIFSIFSKNSSTSRTSQLQENHQHSRISTHNVC